MKFWDILKVEIFKIVLQQHWKVYLSGPWTHCLELIKNAVYSVLDKWFWKYLHFATRLQILFSFLINDMLLVILIPNFFSIFYLSTVLDVITRFNIFFPCTPHMHDTVPSSLSLSLCRIHDFINISCSRVLLVVGIPHKGRTPNSDVDTTHPEMGISVAICFIALGTRWRRLRNWKKGGEENIPDSLPTQLEPIPYRYG